MKKEKTLEEIRKERFEEVRSAQICKECGLLILRGSMMISDGYYHLECVGKKYEKMETP